MKEEEEASLKSLLSSIFIAPFWGGGVRLRPNTAELGRAIVLLADWACARVARKAVILHDVCYGGAR